MSHMLPRGPAEDLQHSAEPTQATVGMLWLRLSASSKGRASAASNRSEARSDRPTPADQPKPDCLAPPLFERV